MKKEYDIEYAKIYCKQIKLLLNKRYDADIIEHLSSVQNVNGYLKDLIRKEINNVQSIQEKES